MIAASNIKRLIGPRWTTWGRTVLRGLGRPRWGNLRRVTPFSEVYGFDRGRPIDRYYVDKVLGRYAASIAGRVLEIQSIGYTLEYGRGVEVSHSLDIDPKYTPTYLCDLADAAIVPSASYDCFLMPNTWCVLGNIEAALREARRIVRPGGVILATVPGFVPLIPDGPDYWHTGAHGWREIVDRVWPGCEIEIQQFGNCLAAVAALYGLAVEELSPAELDYYDPRYPVLTGIFCRTDLRERP